MKHSRYPHEWSKTVRDLLAEGRSASGEELEWARQYERDKLRLCATFPVDGQVFEATTEVHITYLTHWSAPFTGGGNCTLPKGAQVRVSVSDADPEPIAVYADPLDQTFELQIVPASDRINEQYGGFSFSINTEQLNKQFTLVSPAA